jgi:hypothetical protein
VAVADVNGDGRLDLAVANYSYGASAGSVSVLLGNGNGTFQGAVNFAVGSIPVSVAVADVNGDGRPDLVTANQSGNSVSVLLGNGNGTFQSAVNFGVGSSPRSVAVADVNGDGRPDLVTANFGSGSVSVLLGNGNGTFHSAVNFYASSPVSGAVADVNGDGRPDLVAASFGGANVSVLLGNRKAATHLQITAPASVTAGTPFTITVKALAAGNGVDDLYTGTVTFTSSDGAAVLPADYTFTKADLGVHTFTLSTTLNTTGPQTVTATDTVKSTITGSASVTVNSPSAAPPSPGGRSGGTAPAAAAGSVAPDLPGQGDAVRARALAALLAEGSFLDTGPNPHVLGVTGIAAGGHLLAADTGLTSTLAAHISVRIAAVPGLPGEELVIKAGLRRNDLEAFFAVEPFGPGGG